MEVTIFAAWHPPRQDCLSRFILHVDAGINNRVYGRTNRRVIFTIVGDVEFELPPAISWLNHYVFDGWFLDQYFEVPVANYTELRNMLGNATEASLYARFRPFDATIDEMQMPVFSLTLDAGVNGHIDGHESRLVQFSIYGNDAFDLPGAIRVTRDGYEFVGWYLGKSSDQRPIGHVASYSDLRYMFRWETEATLIAAWRSTH